MIYYKEKMKLCIWKVNVLLTMLRVIKAFVCFSEGSVDVTHVQSSTLTLGLVGVGSPESSALVPFDEHGAPLSYK